MDKDAMIQAAESYWLAAINGAEYARIKWQMDNKPEEYSWHWFWLILAESIWPEEEPIIPYLDQKTGMVDGYAYLLDGGE